MSKGQQRLDERIVAPRSGAALALRAMQVDDLPVVMQIERAAYEFPWTEGIFRDCLRVGYCCEVMESPAGIVGYGVMSMGAGECHLLNVCVRPDHQRRGLGETVVRHLLAIARSRGINMALLEARRSNAAAHRLYTRMGFNEIGLRKAYYPSPRGREDAVVFAMAL